MNQHFIWIDPRKYPDLQTCRRTRFSPKDNDHFCVAAFRKEHVFSRKVRQVTVRVFGDTMYSLWLNGEFLCSGPVCPGGDYGTQISMPVQYFSEYTVSDSGNILSFFAQVCLSPIDMANVSCGHGGFSAEYTVQFSDGTEETFYTDPSWQCRPETHFLSILQADFSAAPAPWEPAVPTENIWNLKKSPINNLVYRKIQPTSLSQNDAGQTDADFDKIYSAYVFLRTKQDCQLKMEVLESPNSIRRPCYTLSMKGGIPFQSLRLDSVGTLMITGTEPENIEELYIIASHYPVTAEGSFRCSDEMLNLIYEVGKHTTNICRQSLELDSPLHQENLGDTGDYLIESLIAYYCFGDTTLSRFDCIRVADYLKLVRGKLFHTSYSLIWVDMVYDNYLFSGDRTLLEEIREALDILLERFASYEGENSLLETCEDYMFIDWIPIDGYNLHHPPKALGQSAMNAFYYRALGTAAKIYGILGDEEKKASCLSKADAVKSAFNACFYDSSRGLYFGGLSTPDQGTKWLPANPDKRYFIPHSNVLACLYGLAEDPEGLLERTLNDPELPDVQPYFMHFVLEAIYECGLFPKYGLPQIRRWEKQMNECTKGMKEAWGDYPGYAYDYSHAWAATPTYQLMSKLTGLKILEPGFKKISLDPHLFGLEFAEITIPTPYGPIHCRLGKEQKITVPEGIDCTILEE